MPSMTLLEIVQDILSDLDSDEVNSISDTVESAQVAQIVKTTYFNLIDGKDWPHLYSLFQLTPSGTTARPTHMSFPSTVEDVHYIKYNVRDINDTKDIFQKITWKTPEDFMDIVNKRSTAESEVTEVTDPTGISINIYNERPPQYYTSFDNDNVVFDAYDIAVDSTLTAAKTECYGKLYPTWTVSDTFVPDLPVNSFSYLLNESKSVAFLILKQAANPKAEQHSVSQRRRMSQEAWKIKNGIKYPSYGRK